MVIWSNHQPISVSVGAQEHAHVFWEVMAVGIGGGKSNSGMGCGTGDALPCAGLVTDTATSLILPSCLLKERLQKLRESTESSGQRK